MPTMEVPLRRFSVVSLRPFDEVVRMLTSAIGQPDMTTFHGAIAAAANLSDLQKLVESATGCSQLMEFARFDAGAILRKRRDGQDPRILRLVVGNPLIMMQMVAEVPDAASYAPVSILIDERADGIHLSYDSMASLIAPYGSETAVAVATDLDMKIERLLEAAAK